MRTKIFAYNGYIGVMSGENYDGLLLEPSEFNNNCVINSLFVDVSLDALNLLKDVKKTKKKNADIDIFKDGEVILIGWLGGYMTAFKASDVEASIGYNPELLIPVDDIEATEDFKNFIDSLS